MTAGAGGTGVVRLEGSTGLHVAAAAFSAAAFVAAFPPLGAWPLAFVMFAPLVAALDRASLHAAFWTTYGFYVASGIAIVRWLVVPMAADYGVAPWRAWLFTLGIVGLYSLVPAAGAALWATLRPRFSAALAPISLASIWVLGEALRAGPLALPWLLSGHAVIPSPAWIQIADLGGATAVGFPVVAVSAGIGIAFSRRSWRPLVVPLLVAASAFSYGVVRLAESHDAGASLRVGVVQASVPPRDRFVPGSVERNLARHLVATRSLLDQGPHDLVVWSETSIDAYLEGAPEVVDALQQFVDDTGVPLVTGAPRNQAPGIYTNSIVLFTPGSSRFEGYDKQRLVPFAEYDPALGSWLDPLIGELMRDEPYTAGTEPRVLRSGPLPLAAPICFEVTYPDEMRRFREGGALLLLNLSNDAWFGRTGFAQLHLGHAQLRAVELRTWIVRGANTGISALIDPTGQLRGSLGVFTEGTLSGQVRAAGPPPIFARWGSDPILALLIAGVALGAMVGPRKR